MKLSLLKIVAITTLTGVLFMGCIKNKDIELGDAGTVLVKILEAPEKKYFYAPFADIKTVDVFSLRKDVPTNAELNSATPVKVTFSSDYISRYNTDHGTAYEVLPDSLFTTTVPKTGNVYDMSLAGGQTAEEFTIKLNGAKWDVSKTYALAYYISEAGGKKLSVGKDTVIAFFGIINQWDGAYEVTGSMTDNVNSALTAILPMVYHLVTASTTSVAGYDPVYLGDFFVPILNSGAISGYGSFAPVFSLDPVTNKVTKVVNYYGQPAGNGRSAGLDPSGENQYIADTKTIKVKFFMYQPGTKVRTAFDWEMKYTGLR